MKLLKCKGCSDMVALRAWEKQCKCGESSGHFVESTRTVMVKGPCVVLGVRNVDFFEIREPNEFIKRDDLS